MSLKINTTIKTLMEALNKQQAENDNFKAELAWFRHKYFGALSERRVDDEKLHAHKSRRKYQTIPKGYGTWILSNGRGIAGLQQGE